MGLAHLTECEQQVMKILWEAERELGLMEVMQRVNETYHRDWKPQTVSTFLARLVKKSYLESYRQGRVFYYRILVSMEDYVAKMTRQFVDLWYQGDVEAFWETVKKHWEAVPETN